MAWPLTRYRTMVNGSTFWDDAFGNALQDGVNGLCLGSYSHNVLVADGAGGVAFAAPTADTPLVRLYDRTGKLRGGADHIGYPLGSRNLEFREDWTNGFQSSITASTNPMAFAAWQYDVVGTAFSAFSLAAATTPPSYRVGWPTMGLSSTGAAVGNKGGITTRGQLLLPTADTIAVWEGEISLSNSTTAFSTFGMGLGSTRTPLHGDSSFKAIFDLTSNGTTATLTARASAGAGDTIAFSQSVVAVQVYKLRIEIAGSSTFWGAVVRFFIDGTLVGTANLNLAGTPLYGVAAYAVDEGTFGDLTFVIGPVRLFANRFVNAPGL